MRTPRDWQVLLLLPQPPLSLLYLLAVRAERVAPSFLPLAALAALPACALVLGVRGLVREPAARRRHLALAGVALLELAWTVLAEAMVGFAIAWRSG